MPDLINNQAMSKVGCCRQSLDLSMIARATSIKKRKKTHTHWLKAKLFLVLKGYTVIDSGTKGSTLCVDVRLVKGPNAGTQ